MRINISSSCMMACRSLVKNSLEFILFILYWSSWCLNQEHDGSLNTDKLVEHLIDSINKIRPVQNNTFEEITIKLENISKRESKFVKPSATPPLFLKACKLENVTATEVLLSIEDWPTVIMGDSCSANIATGTKLNDYLGLLTPSIRCTIPAADGSIKRITNSKTRNLQVISDFLPDLCSVLRHFQLSGKSNDLLHEVLELMEMKPIPLMSFCPTRMSYILTACSQAVKQLVALCHVLVTEDIKKEQRDTFLSPNDDNHSSS